MLQSRDKRRYANRKHKRIIKQLGGSGGWTSLFRGSALNEVVSAGRFPREVTTHARQKRIGHVFNKAKGCLINKKPASKLGCIVWSA